MSDQQRLLDKFEVAKVLLERCQRELLRRGPGAAQLGVTIFVHARELGPHDTQKAPGALPNGTRVRKIASEPGDGRRDGALGTVLGSIAPPKPLPGYEHIHYCYFVEWDAQPRLAVSVVDRKLAREDQRS